MSDPRILTIGHAAEFPIPNGSKALAADCWMCDGIGLWPPVEREAESVLDACPVCHGLGVVDEKSSGGANPRAVAYQANGEPNPECGATLTPCADERKL